jgi:eukaryotic-like serine/threonine-protein kinase
VIRIGRVISRFEILEKLGEGGMGVVWKAHDKLLDRVVALKVLHAGVVADPDRKRRFMQEAKAASALNHPNIITIYDISQEDAIDFIVMEHVRGAALDRLIKRLRPADTLKYAIQIADALSKAHAAGVVHRDLKPANIMVSDEGSVKVVDFGLAKLTEPIGTTELDATQTIGVATAEGVIVGTVFYMSPEQAEGKKVDARSDIFAFGAVLYEMVTGKRAFQCDTKTSTLAAILYKEPPAASAIAQNVSRDLERIIKRCLRKDPARRFQHMDDVKVALEEMQEEKDSGHLSVESAPRRPWANPWPAVVGLTLVISVLVAWWFWYYGRQPNSAYGPVRPLTTYVGIESEPDLSPDGRQIAFAWNGPNQDNFDIYIRLVDGGSALRLTTDAAPDHAPAWSPDGQRLAFLRDSAIYLIPALGGVERKLLQMPRGSLFLNLSASTSISWSPDGRFLAFNSAEDGAAAIWIASTESGEVRKISNAPKGYYMELSPAFSPDGRTLAYIRAMDSYSRTVVLQDMNRDGTAQGPAREILPYTRRIDHLAWQPDGRGLILAIRDMGERSGLFRLKPGGMPEPMGLDSGILSWPSPSRTGYRMAYQKRLLNTNIYRMDGPGPGGGPRPYEQCHVTAVVASTALEREPMLSPDGRRLVFNSDRLGYYELHVAGADGSNQVALTAMGPIGLGSPRWSPDGQTIAFDRYENGHSTIYTIGAGGGKPRRITDDHFRDIRPSFSRDGKWIYFSSNRSGRIEIWKVPAEGGAPQQVTHNSGIEPFESPDGKLLYYVSGQSLWALPTAGGDPKKVLDEPVFPVYALSGRSIYYGVRNPPGLWVLRTDIGKKFEYTRFPKLAFGFDGGTVFSVSNDERTIFFSQMDRQESDLMLVENFR